MQRYGRILGERIFCRPFAVHVHNGQSAVLPAQTLHGKEAEREREQRRNKQYIRAKAVFFCPFRLHWINPFHKKSVRLCRTDFLW